MLNERYGQIAIAAVILIALFFAREFLGGTAEDETATETAPTTSISGTTTIADSPKIGSEAPAPVEIAAPKGKFDYYVLTMSWSPTHCASEQGADDEMQCRSGRPYGFVLHGLWPQHERGYPEFCLSGEPKRMSDAAMRQMLEVSPSEDLVQHEWQKHGTCAGLSQDDYAATAVKAFKAVDIPDDYEQPAKELKVSPDGVRDAFLSANPQLQDSSVTTICRGGDLSEVWVCLGKDLTPRACAADVAKRDCTRRNIRMRAVRGDWSRYCAPRRRSVTEIPQCSSSSTFAVAARGTSLKLRRC